MTRHTGIDAHKAHKADLHVTVLDETGEEADHFTVVNEAAGHTVLSDRLTPDDLVGIEASTVCYPVVEHLLREEFTVRVGHPAKLSRLMDPDFKTTTVTAGTSPTCSAWIGCPRRTTRTRTRFSPGTCSVVEKI